ncbi:MAG: ABC transporter permease subunit, partial [Actinobacteria bacterium]|nr:ABC transporter permease subunit [Actinomycetota bacterium]NIV90446.1 ABC transporter permease subunit [Actinomycetota bacterium]NIX24993.1 ABC transporter permease subunit [Actinomycetota bacterium]
MLSLLAILPPLVTFFVVSGASEAAALRRFHDVSMSLLFILVLPIVCLLFGAAALGDERRDATLTVLVLRPIRREGIVGAKLAAAWLASTAIVGSSALATGVVLGVSGGTWEVLVPLVAGIALSALAYVAVFLILGHTTTRAVLIGLVYVFLWENAISFAVDGLAVMSLFRIGVSGYAALVDAAPRQLADVLGSLTPGMLGAAAKAGGLAVIATLSGGWLLRRRDLT